MKNVVNRILLTKEIKCEIIFQSFLKTDMQRFSSEETGPGFFSEDSDPDPVFRGFKSGSG